MDNHTYYYLHTNNKLINKSAIVIDSDPEYFFSPFVKKWWRVELDSFESITMFIIDAEKQMAENVKDILVDIHKNKYISAEQVLEILHKIELLNEI